MRRPINERRGWGSGQGKGKEHCFVLELSWDYAPGDDQEIRGLMLPSWLVVFVYSGNEFKN